MLELNSTEQGLSGSGPPHYKFDNNDRTVFFKGVPSFVSRDDLKEAALRIYDELESIYLSEPLRMYHFERFAWLTFKSEETAQNAF